MIAQYAETISSNRLVSFVIVTKPTPTTVLTQPVQALVDSFMDEILDYWNEQSKTANTTDVVIIMMPEERDSIRLHAVRRPDLLKGLVEGGFETDSVAEALSYEAGDLSVLTGITSFWLVVIIEGEVLCLPVTKTYFAKGGVC